MNKNLPEWKVQKTFDQNSADMRLKASRPDLTPEEQARPFAKYYFEDIKQPDPAHYAAMEQPMDPSKSFGPEEINRLLDVEELEKGVEVGWCWRPDGSGYIANKIFYPGVTAEMIDWWFAWHPLEDLRYRIWYPPPARRHPPEPHGPRPDPRSQCSQSREELGRDPSRDRELRRRHG